RGAKVRRCVATWQPSNRGCHSPLSPPAPQASGQTDSVYIFPASIPQFIPTPVHLRCSGFCSQGSVCYRRLPFPSRGVALFQAPFVNPFPRAVSCTRKKRPLLRLIKRNEDEVAQTPKIKPTRGAERIEPNGSSNVLNWAARSLGTAYLRPRR